MSSHALSTAALAGALLHLAAAAPATAQTYVYPRPVYAVPQPAPYGYPAPWGYRGYTYASPRSYSYSSFYSYPARTPYSWPSSNPGWSSSGGDKYWPTGRDVPMAKPWLQPR